MQGINFDTIVKTYQTLVFRTVLGFLHTREDAEDLTQEIFICAYNKFSTFRGDSEISTWLYRIAVNMSINAAKQKARRNVFVDKSKIDTTIMLQPSADANPEQQMQQHETDKIVRNAIDSLPDNQRTAFILSKYNDLSQKQISEIMKLSEGAVEQHLQRAKKTLQKKLEKLVGKK